VYDDLPTLYNDLRNDLSRFFSLENSDTSRDRAIAEMRKGEIINRLERYAEYPRYRVLANALIQRVKDI
jgi:hypothetical protein